MARSAPRTLRRPRQKPPEVRRLEVLYEVSRRLTAVHETDEMLALIVNEAARLLGVEATGLRLVEGDDWFAVLKPRRPGLSLDDLAAAVPGLGWV